MNTENKALTFRVAVTLAWPAIALLTFAAIPLGLLFRVSLAPQDPNGFWLPGLTWESFASATDRTLLQGLAYSLGLALVVASISVMAGFPLTYFITGMRRNRQIAWLIFLLATLSLSDV